MRKDQYLAYCAENAINPKWCYLGNLMTQAAAPIFEATAAGTLVPAAASAAPTLTAGQALANSQLLKTLATLGALYGAGTNNMPLAAGGLAGMLALKRLQAPHQAPISSGNVYQR